MRSRPKTKTDPRDQRSRDAQVGINHGHANAEKGVYGEVFAANMQNNPRHAPRAIIMRSVAIRSGAHANRSKVLRSRQELIFNAT
jgi:hypothetical protein